MARKTIDITKYAAEVLDQQVDFTPVLAGSESISSGAVSASGLTIASVSTSSPIISFRVSGGTAGQVYNVDVKATLNTGEQIIQRLVYTVI